MELLNIAIVEDERTHAEIISEYIEKWAAAKEGKCHDTKCHGIKCYDTKCHGIKCHDIKCHGILCRISQFPNAESFLFEWEENRVWDVLFLDIQMPGIDGVELARKIREQDDRTAIIFVTGISDYMQEGYEVSALHYLVKPVDASKISACLDRVMKEHGENAKEKMFLLDAEDVTEGAPGERKTVKISAKEILYIESFAHETELHTGQGVYRVREGIGTWQKRLADSGFAGSHRSYLVNLLYVLRVEKKEVVLDTEERLPLSRRNRNEFNTAFIRFYSRYPKEDEMK